MGVTCRLRRIDPATFVAATPQRLHELLRDGEDLDKAWDGILWLISQERRDETPCRIHRSPRPRR